MLFACIFINLFIFIITSKKKTKLKDKLISQKVRELVPDSQSYVDLLAFERKLDTTILRKRLDIQESLKRPVKIKKKLRVFITNQFYPTNSGIDSGNDEDEMPQWELKIEGKIQDEINSSLLKTRARKFSSFFKSLVIELDRDLYGPDNHLVEVSLFVIFLINLNLIENFIFKWHRTSTTAETDGFQVKRHGDQSLKCTILMLLDYQVRKLYTSSFIHLI